MAGRSRRIRPRGGNHAPPVRAEGPVDGLLGCCELFKPDCLVIGAGRHGVAGRVSLGSVGHALMHSAEYPVCVAPFGYREKRISKFTRTNILIGDSVNARLFQEAANFSTRAEVDVRIVSIQTRSDNEGKTDAELLAHGQAKAEAAAEKLRPQLDPILHISTSAIVGQDVQDGAEQIEWQDNGIAFFGSAKITTGKKLFLGSIANRILRTLPVPMVVCPNE